jgi:uncharacterized membrane protein YsdA (DUF1294 family)
MGKRGPSSQQRQSQPPNRRNPPQHDRRARFARRSPNVRFGAIAAVLALGIVLVLGVVLGLHWYVAWIAGWSVITFLMYGFDKRRSKGDAERVPEIVLHVLSLIGGFLGGWAGRAYFRHKTLHTSFLITLIISTLLHLGIILYLVRPLF